MPKNPSPPEQQYLSDQVKSQTRFPCDIYAVCARLEKQDARIPRPPGPTKHGTTHIAFRAPLKIAPTFALRYHEISEPALGMD